MHKINFNANKNVKYSTLDAFKIFFWSLIFTQLASFIVVFVLSNISATNGITYNELISNKWIVLALMLIYPAVLTALFFNYNSKYNFDIKKACGLNFKFDYIQVGITLLLSFSCLFLIAPFINLLDSLYKWIGYSPNSNLLFNMTTPLDLILSILVVALVPAVVEETIFRGVILRGLLGKFKPHIAIILSALFFMLIHGSLQQTVYQFILGIVLGYVAIFGGIHYAMLLHFFNNGIVLIINYFSTPVDTVAPIMASNVIIAIIMFIFAIAVFVGLLKYMKNVGSVIAKQNQVMNSEADKDIEVMPDSQAEISNKSGVKGKEGWLTTALNKNEVLYLTMSLVFSISIWLANTISSIS